MDETKQINLSTSSILDIREAYLVIRKTRETCEKSGRGEVGKEVLSYEIWVLS